VTVTFRTPGTGDAEKLAALGVKSFSETFGHLYRPEDLALFLENHTAEKWRAALADRALAIRLGEADGQAVAYAKLTPPELPVEIREPAIELKQFYVLNGWQGAGVAAPLMDWVIEEAGNRGAQGLYLSVFTENERAQRFYARFGFTEVGRQKFMVGSHADEDIVMRRGL